MLRIGVNGGDYMCAFCDNEQPLYERKFRSELTGDTTITIYIDRVINCMIAQTAISQEVIYIEYCPKCGKRINPPKEKIKKEIDSIFPK